MPHCPAQCVRFATVQFGNELLERNFSAEVALFLSNLRVSGCGLFFARQIAVAGSNALRILGTVRREIRWILQIHTKLENTSNV